MSLLGYDNNDKTLSGDVDIYATNLYATNIYDGAVNVGDTLITLQAEIDALQTQINTTGTTGYYGIYGSSNSPTNPLTVTTLYFNQTISQNGFTITGGTGTSATRITATYAGVYNIYYRVSYQKVNITTAYDVRLWLLKNGTNLNYSTITQTFSLTAQHQPMTAQYIVALSAGDYLEINWYSPNTNASSDILDYNASSTPYPQVSSQFVCIQQIANTDTGLGAVFNVASTNTLPAGSSASVVDTTTSYPTYVNHSLVFNIPKGDKGDTGSKGDTGAKGDTGSQGAKGDTGDTNATALSALALASTAIASTSATAVIVYNQGVVQTAQGTAISILQSEVSTIQGDLVIDEGNITALQTKTQLQSYDTLNSRTQFTNDLQLTGTYRGAQIITTGTGTFYNINTTQEINAGTDLNVSGITYLGRTQPSAKKLVLYDNNTGSNYEYLGASVSTDGFNQYLNYNVNSVNSEHRFLYANSASTAKQILSLNPTATNLTTNSLNFRAKDITSSNRDAGIDITNISSLASDLGQLNIRAGSINIGNSSGASVVNINGIVNMPFASGIQMVGGFLSQF